MQQHLYLVVTPLDVILVIRVSEACLLAHTSMFFFILMSLLEVALKVLPRCCLFSIDMPMPMVISWMHQFAYVSRSRIDKTIFMLNSNYCHWKYWGFADYVSTPHTTASSRSWQKCHLLSSISETNLNLITHILLGYHLTEDKKKVNFTQRNKSLEICCSSFSISLQLSNTDHQQTIVLIFYLN